MAGIIVRVGPLTPILVLGPYVCARSGEVVITIDTLDSGRTYSFVGANKAFCHVKNQDGVEETDGNASIHRVPKII
jgi:hypothetical protein